MDEKLDYVMINLTLMYGFLNADNLATVMLASELNLHKWFIVT